ncbi:hypothetical protein BGX38DRAFT_1188967 [Terfezia claveryi]|nr:hypothetical protein BGX38DRAFT_1188967 [Terfezia claveryi]
MEFRLLFMRCSCFLFFLSSVCRRWRFSYRLFFLIAYPYDPSVRASISYSKDSACRQIKDHSKLGRGIIRDFCTIGFRH